MSDTGYTIGEVKVLVRPIMDKDELRRVVEEATATASSAAQIASSASTQAAGVSRMSGLTTGSPAVAMRASFLADQAGITAGVSRAQFAVAYAGSLGAQSMMDELAMMPALGAGSGRRTIEDRQNRLRGMMNDARSPLLEAAISEQYGRNASLLEALSAGGGSRGSRQRAREARRVERAIQRVSVRRRGSGGGSGGMPPFAAYTSPESSPLMGGAGRGRGMRGGGGGGFPPIGFPPGGGAGGAGGGGGRRGGGGGGGRGFLGAPNSMGIAMNLMFGGWEVANALQASGQASRVASHFPGDYARQAEANLQAVDAVSGGILGSVAGLIADPMRTRSAAARTMLGGGIAGNTLASLMAQQEEEARLSDIGVAGRRAAPMARSLFSGLAADENLSNQQAAMMEQRRQADTEAHASYRANYVDRAARGMDRLTSRYLGGGAGWVVGTATPYLMETFMSEDIDAAVASDLRDRREIQNRQGRRNRAARRRGLENTVEDLRLELNTEIDDLRNIQQFGPLVGGALNRRHQYDRTVASANQGLNLLADQVERLGFDRPDLSGARHLLDEWRNSMVGQDQKNIDSYRQRISRANSAASAAMGFQLRAMPWEAQREAIEQRADAEMRALREQFPHMSYDEILNDLGIRDRAKNEAGLVDQDERNTRRSLGINLTTRENVARAHRDVRSGRRSRFAPQLEGLYGNYRAELEQLNQQGLGDVAGRLQGLYVDELEAIRSQFLSEFRPAQAGSLNSIDTSGREFRRISEDFSNARTKSIAEVMDTDASYARYLQMRANRLYLEQNMNPGF